MRAKVSYLTFMHLRRCCNMYGVHSHQFKRMKFLYNQRLYAVRFPQFA